jgi:hypothetical protein
VCVPHVEEVEEEFTVKVPVWTEEEREFTVMVPVQEEREGTRHVCKMVEVKETRTVCRDEGQWEERVVETACGGGCGCSKKCCRRRCCGGCTTSCGGCASGCGTVQTTCKVWVPNIVKEEVEVTCMKPEMVEETYTYHVTVCKPETQKKTVKVCSYKDETRTRTVKKCSMVQEEREQEYTVMVPKTVEEEVQVQVCRMVEKKVTVPVYSCGGCCKAKKCKRSCCGGC